MSTLVVLSELILATEFHMASKELLFQESVEQCTIKYNQKCLKNQAS